jgi:hypothetical protein
MKAHEFLPGIEFLTFERSAYTWKYDPYYHDDGKRIHIVYSNHHRAHVTIQEHHIIIWSIVGDVYVASKPIAYEDLILVSTPVIA